MFCKQLHSVSIYVLYSVPGFFGNRVLQMLVHKNVDVTVRFIYSLFILRACNMSFTNDFIESQAIWETHIDILSHKLRMQLVFCKGKSHVWDSSFSFTLCHYLQLPHLTSNIYKLSITDDPPITVFCIRRWAERSSAPGSSHNVHTQDGLTLHVPAVNTLFVPFI